jgi:hypothetical protein
MTFWLKRRPKLFRCCVTRSTLKIVAKTLFERGVSALFTDRLDLFAPETTAYKPLHLGADLCIVLLFNCVQGIQPGI